MRDNAYLIVRDSDGLAVNAIVWDGVSDYTPPEGHTLVACTDAPGAWAGWTRNPDGTWTPAQPFPSWVLVDGDWQPPTPMPSDGGPWEWDEDTLSWVEVTA